MSAPSPVSFCYNNYQSIKWSIFRTLVGIIWRKSNEETRYTSTQSGKKISTTAMWLLIRWPGRQAAWAEDQLTLTLWGPEQRPNPPRLSFSWLQNEHESTVNAAWLTGVQKALSTTPCRVSPQTHTLHATPTTCWLQVPMWLGQGGVHNWSILVKSTPFVPKSVPIWINYADLLKISMRYSIPTPHFLPALLPSSSLLLLDLLCSLLPTFQKHWFF